MGALDGAVACPSRLAAAAVLAAALTFPGCAKTVTIGAIVSSSGAAASSGESVRRGLDLALEEINAQGGVNGRSVEILYRDDATHPDVGLRRLDELTEEHGVGLVIGAVTSPVTLRLAERCEARRILLLSPTASASRITGAGAFVFRVHPSELLEGEAMADFALDLGEPGVAVIAVQGDYGDDLRQAFVSRCQGRGRPAGSVASFAEGDADGIARAARATAALAPSIVYVPAYARDTFAVAEALRGEGSGAVILASSSVVAADFPRGGRDLAPFVFADPTPDPGREDSDASSFAASFQERFGEAPDTYAAHGYDALGVLAVALRSARSSEPEAVRRALSSIDDYRGATGRIAFDPQGDVLRYPALFVVDEGVAVPYDRFVEAGGAVRPARR